MRLFPAFAAICGLVSLWGCGGRAIRSSRPAPDFRVALLHGGAISLKDLRGKPSVINFWATWCGPCVDELPAFQEVWRRYRGKVNFLAVATSNSRKEVVKFAREHRLTMPVAVDRGDEMARKFNYYGLPTTVLLTAEGKIADTNTGPLPGPLLEKKIERLLGKG